MKWINIKNVLLNKLNILTFIPELLSRKKVWVSYALPRWKKTNYNWGDDVNSVLVNIISSKVVIPYQCSLLKRKHYLCIGSIIQWYSDENAVIWGSGLLYPVESLKSPKQVLAVRGPLTRECLIKCGISCPPVYGDPALLFPRYYNPIIQKRYKFGIICHVSEINDIKHKFDLKNDCLFINIKGYGKWTNFIDQILSCEIILSSSLHGIIISDAYSVPNLWCQFTNYVAENNGFKFKDYYLSVKKNIDKPFILETSIDICRLESLVKERWSKPIIDLDLLLEVCPFT